MTIRNTFTRPRRMIILWVALIVAGTVTGACCCIYGTRRAVAFFLVAALGALGILFWTPWETRYECLFDEGTTYTEISGQWNVKEQRGMIWVVTEKEGDGASEF